MIKDILKDIKLASENKAYFSALALALTIPDICGKIEYKDTVLNNKEKYIKWFDKWIYNYVKIPESDDELFNSFDKLAIFNGGVCYALRCAYLHSGNYDLREHGKENVNINRFELCVSDQDFISGEAHGCSMSNGVIKEVHRRFNVNKLINYFVLGTEDYIEKCGDNSKKYATINIINFKGEENE